MVLTDAEMLEITNQFDDALVRWYGFCGSATCPDPYCNIVRDAQELMSEIRNTIRPGSSEEE